jgi:nitrite reductase/ring-hydroxylating ferredoxin subunit
LSRGTVEAAAEGTGCFVRCPMHGWRFDLATGDSNGRPANATVYTITQKDESLYIEL